MAGDSLGHGVCESRKGLRQVRKVITAARTYRGPIKGCVASFIDTGIAPTFGGAQRQRRDFRGIFVGFVLFAAGTTAVNYFYVKYFKGLAMG